MTIDPSFPKSLLIHAICPVVLIKVSAFTRRVLCPCPKMKDKLHHLLSFNTPRSQRTKRLK